MRGASSGADRLPYVVALIWLGLTVSLASWWLVVGLTLSSQLRAPSVLSTDFRRMFLWEGAVFIGLLIAGGVALVMTTRREQQRRRALETFFMSFTHDLKTSLASVQLQAEGLREDWPEATSRPSLDRLLHDTVRVQIQLENSLFVAQPDGRFLREQVPTRRTLERLAEDWPDLTVTIHGDADVVADTRALETVVRNLLQNARIHGGATAVNVEVDPSATMVRLSFTDNGRGVPAEALDRLGVAFSRPASTSSTGVGLFVCKQLVSRMDGRLGFRHAPDTGHGLVVDLELPGVR